MRASDSVESTRITSPRAKTVLYLAVSLVFVGIGALMAREADLALRAWLVLGFFGLCSLVFLWLLVRPQALVLDRTGFTLTGGLTWSPRKVAWRDVQAFFVYRLPRGGKAIGYNYVPGARADSALVRLNRSFGAEAALPRVWPGSPEQMVEKLNAYRSRALAAGQ